ncbi:unnamed protein product [Pleuronectes platessa]|uniref:Uncharacterized protein n=1 Tax=Pleuronectes platessa TaxID=8262 RepID=A0A9N7U561_PLEPL|nr:unnamed protein product [Pleuronectes platessa]
MWKLWFLLYLGTLDFTVSSSPPSPVNVAFSSVNLRNVLHWSPGNSTSEYTIFTVQYAIYGDSVEGSKGRRVNWRGVHQCTDTVRSWCDLSNETWDQEQGYYARVRAVGRRASSKWTMTLRRFDPKLDTSLGPPLVSVETEGNNAIVALKGPMRYQPDNHTPVISMATIYPHMTYNLSVRNGHHGQTHYFTVVSRLYKHHVKHQMEYCFSAKSRLVSIPMQCESSAWLCITTPPDPMTFHLLSLIWGITVPSLCLCGLMVVGYFLHNYLMGKGQKKPDTLNTSFPPPPPTLPPENANFAVISVIKYESDMDSDISDPACFKKKIADPPTSYSLQRPGPPPEYDDLSVSYGFVAVSPQIDVGGEEEERQPWQDRDDGNNLMVEHQKCTAGESHDKKEWRECQGSGLFHVPLNLQSTIFTMGEKMGEKARVIPNGKIDGAAEEAKMALDWLMWAEEGSENHLGGEEVEAAKGGLKLENVFVRQGSEEEAEALREKERGGGPGSDGLDGVLSKWNLVAGCRSRVPPCSSIMASSDWASSSPPPCITGAGPRRASHSLPGVGHFRRARVSFASVFKWGCRTSAAVPFRAEP